MYYDLLVFPPSSSLVHTCMLLSNQLCTVNHDCVCVLYLYMYLGVWNRHIVLSVYSALSIH